MNGLLIHGLLFIARVSAALLWVWFAGPWIARSFGIPVQAAFWRMDRQKQRLTRLQFVVAFGVLIFGVGLFIFNCDSETIQRVLLEKRWTARFAYLGFSLALSVFMGIIIGFVCAPAQIDEPQVTDLGLSRRK
jgi:hypothetical protein